MRIPPIIVTGMLTLAACSSGTVKNTLGLERSPPDEFRVVSRPPLSVPPQFDLPTPSVAAQPANQLPTSKQAQSLLTGGVTSAPETAGAPAISAPTNTKVKPVKPATGAEARFLQHAGATQTDPNVREKIVQERMASQQDPVEEKSWWDVFSSNPPKKDPIVNASKEAQRIKTDQDSGQPVTTGDTPVVKQKDTGVLGRIFGY